MLLTCKKYIYYHKYDIFLLVLILNLFHCIQVIITFLHRHFYRGSEKLKTYISFCTDLHKHHYNTKFGSRVKWILLQVNKFIRNYRSLLNLTYASGKQTDVGEVTVPHQLEVLAIFLKTKSEILT